jgi:type II secretory ATPase GspE/PulE/Tfp pilus assembly ATPase PilB-like protein
MEKIDLNKVAIHQKILDIVPAQLARSLGVLPVSLQGNTLSVCMKDSNNYSIISRLERIIDYTITPVEPLDITIFKDALVHNYPDSVISGAIDQAVELFEYILSRALHATASDIHICPNKNGASVKLRVDGKMRTDRDVPPQIANELVTYIKVLGKMDISQKRMPLDGNINIMVEGNNISLRVATIPTIHGEHTTLRILSQNEDVVDLNSLNNLGLSSRQYDMLTYALSIPNGVVILSGPTGSGKTTTLYASLRELVKQDVFHIVSIEDPVEKPVSGVTQIKVDSREERVSFHKALRSVLRHDPDVIMIGEIRDAETADIALKSALTGHLVLATLHTNSAAGILTRLVDLGVPSFLVASTLRLVIAQRLVRKPCSFCMEWELADEEICKLYNWNYNDEIKIPKINGCPYCSLTGYSGRTAIYEMLPVNDSIKKLLMNSGSESELHQYLKKSAFELTLRGDALKKVLSGQTTLEEVEATTIDEDNAIFNLNKGI